MYVRAVSPPNTSLGTKDIRKDLYKNFSSDLIFQATETLHIPNDSLGPDANRDISNFLKKKWEVR